LEDGAAQPRTLSLFPEDRCEGLLADASMVRVKLSELQLRRPRKAGDTVVAAVRHMVGGTVRREVRTFKTTTKDLMALSEWLSAEGCTHCHGSDRHLLEAGVARSGGC
jgi:hypothetical protein